AETSSRLPDMRPINCDTLLRWADRLYRITPRAIPRGSSSPMDVLEQELELGHAASSGYSRHRQPSLAGV
ncbi:hypothetical protein, partial [Mesorhizobium sp.]|uniref:hypothetical protein n=1 Tax=Mesorhizobium sp. TaxID=1871066 RepID=UPI0025CD1031